MTMLLFLKHRLRKLDLSFLLKFVKPNSILRPCFKWSRIIQGWFNKLMVTQNVNGIDESKKNLIFAIFLMEKLARRSLIIRNLDSNHFMIGLPKIVSTIHIFAWNLLVATLKVSLNFFTNSDLRSNLID